MKSARFTTLLLILPSLVAAQQKVVVRQPVGEAPHPSLEFDLPADTAQASVPFRTVNNHIVLPITVNGEGPFSIILDTGMPAEALLLHASERVETLHLTYLSGVQVRVAGAGGTGSATPARIADGITLGIGDLRIRNARATVMPAPPGFGAYHDGVIGAALFRHFVVRIDNERSVLTLYRPEAYRPPPGATVVPLSLEHGMPFIDARVQIGKDDPVPAHVVVDLGASHAVSLNESKERRIAAPAGSISTSLGRGASGEITGKIGRIRALELGGLKLADVIASFPGQAAHAPPGLDEHDGNLGSGVLGRFNVSFDYGGNRMVLERTPRVSEPFEWDMAGMQAEPTGEGTVRVRRVLPGSPAAAAGIRADDRIVRIAGEEVNETTYFSLRDRLKRPGSTVAIELRRGERRFEVSLKLRRLV